MGRYTSPLSNPELGDYLKEHLCNELHWLLRAATEWYVQSRLNLGIDGYSVQVYAMDSDFLHARTLFEFFTEKITDYHYGYDAFKINKIGSRLYENGWKDVLHGYMLHAQDRSEPRQLESFDGTTKKDLNKMPVDFAQEAVRLWREFIKSLESHSDPDIKKLAPIAKDCLTDAIKSTENVMSSVSNRTYKNTSVAVAPISW